MAFAQKSKNEISGLGYVRRINSKCIIIDDVFLLPQEVNPDTTTFKPEAYRDFMVQLVEVNEEREQKGQPPLLARLQWHSHVRAGAGFSAQDMIVIDNCQAEWRISLVINQYEEYDIRLDQYKPFRFEIPVELEFTYPGLSIEALEACQKDIDEMVTEIKPPPPPPTPIWQLGQTIWPGGVID